jgi:hypothetical protein
MRRLLTALAIGIFLEAVPGPAWAQTIRFEPIIVKTPGTWPLGRFQRALRDRIQRCRGSGFDANGVLGRYTASAISDLRSVCRLATSDPAAEARLLTPAIWGVVMGDEPFPSVGDRARLLTYNYEGTDYTTFLWNVGEANDIRAFGTWGPFGATLAAGGEIQRIVRHLAGTSDGWHVVARAFSAAAAAGPDFTYTYAWRDAACASGAVQGKRSGLALLMTLNQSPEGLSVQDRADLRAEFCADDRYLTWPRAFLLLGDIPSVRAEYDAFYAVQNRAAVAGFADLYHRLGWAPTEIDWAFFLDRQTQFTTDLALAEEALRALPAGASPAARRLAIGRSHLPDPTHLEQHTLRRGRDMTFVVGALGEAALTAEERAAWEHADPRRAEDFGLSDQRTPAGNPF